MERTNQWYEATADEMAVKGSDMTAVEDLEDLRGEVVEVPGAEWYEAAAEEAEL